MEIFGNIGLWVAYILIGLCALGAIISAAIDLSHNPKTAKYTIIGLAAFILLVIVAYSISTGEVKPHYGDDITETQVRLAETGLYLLYVTGTLAILSLVYSELSAIFK